MNRYLLTGLTVACLGAYASENPFDLKQNLHNLDADQSAMLTELRKAEKSDVFLDDEPLKEKANPVQMTPPSPALEENSTAAVAQVVGDTAAPQTSEVTEAKPQEKVEEPSAVPEKSEETADVPVQQKVEEENVTAEPAVNKTVAEEKPAVNEAQEVQKEEKKSTPLPAVEEQMPPATAEKEEVSPSKTNTDENAQMSQDDIDRLYQEAIKEVEGN